MATGPSRYNARFAVPEQLVRGTAVRIFAPLYLDGALVAPDSASLRILSPSGAEMLEIASTDIDDDVAQDDVTAGATWPYQDGYSVEWTLTVDGTTLTFATSACVCRKQLLCPIAEPDLYLVAPGLNGAAASARSSRTNYQPFIEAAWIEIQNRLIQDGRRPHLISDATALRGAALRLALHHVYLEFSSRQPEPYARMAADQLALFESTWTRTTLRYAAGDDSSGGVESGRREARPSALWLGRG
jgi:hypothetical protein